MDKHWNWRLNWKYRIGQSRLPNTVHRKNWTKSKAITSPSHGKKSWKSTSAHVWRSEFRKMFSLLPHSHLILTLLVCVCVCIVCTLLVFQFNSIQSSKLRITKNSNSNWRRYNTDVGVTLYIILHCYFLVLHFHSQETPFPCFWFHQPWNLPDYD